MAEKKKTAPKKEVAIDVTSFNEAQLKCLKLIADNPKEPEEVIVEEFTGYHPNYFLYEGKLINFNLSQFEYDERVKEAKEKGYNRKHFTGWKPKPQKYGGTYGR